MDYREFLQFHRECCDEMVADIVNNPQNFGPFCDFMRIVDMCGSWDADKIAAMQRSLLSEANSKIVLACYLKAVAGGGKPEPDSEPDPLPEPQPPVVGLEKKIPVSNPVPPKRPSPDFMAGPATPKPAPKVNQPMAKSPVIY